MEYNLVIPDDIYQKIMYWINKSDHEVSGFGSLDYDPETDTFTVRDAILLKQEVGPTSTEICPKAIGKAMFEQREQVNALKWHWHSHVNMAVFWSSDDRKLIDSLGGQGWIVATVFNKKHEMKTAIQLKVEALGYEHDHFIDDIPTEVLRFIPKEWTEAWDKEYKEKVAEEKKTYYAGQGNALLTGIYDASNWHDERNWHPTKTKLREGFVAKSDKKAPINVYESQSCAMYNKQGWKWSFTHNRAVYNPMYDTALRTEEQIVHEVMTMDSEEVDEAFAYVHDTKSEFTHYYDEAVQLAALYSLEEGAQ